jgi:steroid 5-alpha reductase family enzyme
MSSSSESMSWVDRWWPLLVILFGILFVTILDTFAPTI